MVVYFWTSSFVVRTSKIHIVLVRRDKWIEKKVSCPVMDCSRPLALSANSYMDLDHYKYTTVDEAACKAKPGFWLATTAPQGLHLWAIRHFELDLNQEQVSETSSSAPCGKTKLGCSGRQRGSDLFVTCDNLNELSKTSSSSRLP